jgi:hypothetical protein
MAYSLEMLRSISKYASVDEGCWKVADGESRG